MAAARTLLDRVRDALTDIDGIVEKRMFGSTAFMIRGKLAIAARDDRLFCRIDPALEAAALAREGTRRVVMHGRPMRGYLHVDAAAVVSSRALKYWIDRVLAYNATLLAGPPPRG